MRTSVILITYWVILFGAACFAQKNLAKCPEIRPIEPIPIESLLGTWYAMRVGAPCDSSWDCMTETYWKDKDTPNNSVNVVYHHRINGTNEDYKGVINKTDSDYTWDYNTLDMSFPTTFVATDSGRSWLLAYSCLELQPNNVTVMSGISSRTRSIDPKLEQTLVQEIEKYSGITPNELIGIGQNDCF